MNSTSTRWISFQDMKNIISFMNSPHLSKAKAEFEKNDGLSPEQKMADFLSKNPESAAELMKISMELFSKQAANKAEEIAGHETTKKVLADLTNPAKIEAMRKLMQDESFKKSMEPVMEQLKPMMQDMLSKANKK